MTLSMNDAQHSNTVIMLHVTCLFIVTLNVIMLNVVMLIVVMLNVVAPRLVTDDGLPINFTNLNEP